MFAMFRAAARLELEIDVCEEQKSESTEHLTLHRQGQLLSYLVVVNVSQY